MLNISCEASKSSHWFRQAGEKLDKINDDPTCDLRPRGSFHVRAGWRDGRAGGKAFVGGGLWVHTLDVIRPEIGSPAADAISPIRTSRTWQPEIGSVFAPRQHGDIGRDAPAAG